MKNIQISIDGLDSSTSYSEAADPVSKADMQLFEAEVQYSPAIEEASVADRVIDKFGEVSSEINAKKENFENSLHKATKTGSTEDLLAATRAMSDYYLQVAMSTKVASKATSSIDRITNLQ